MPNPLPPLRLEHPKILKSTPRLPKSDTNPLSYENTISAVWSTEFATVLVMSPICCSVLKLHILYHFLIVRSKISNQFFTSYQTSNPKKPSLFSLLVTDPLVFYLIQTNTSKSDSPRNP